MIMDSGKTGGSVSRRTFLTGIMAAGALSTPASNARRPNFNNKTTGGRSRICCFSKHLQFLDYEAMADTAAEIGFDGVALTVRPRGHVFPERVAEDMPRAVKAVRRAGLDVDMMTTAINDPNDKNTVPVMETAAALGVLNYRMGYLQYDPSKSIEDCLDSHRAVMEKLAAMNEEYGLHGAYQNHSGMYVGAPVWDIWHLVRGLDPRWIGCQYDVRHATVEGGNSWPLGMRLLKDYINISAIKDFRWGQNADGKWRVVNTPVGEGMVDFDKYFGFVKEYGIDGPISVHFEYPMPEKTMEQESLETRRRKTVEVMRKDIEAIRSYMDRAGL